MRLPESSAGPDRRGLSGAGAGLDNEMPFLGEGGFDSFGISTWPWRNS